MLNKINKAVVGTNIAQYSFQVCKSECLGFWPFVITHFNTIVMTLHDWFQVVRMKLRGCQVGFPDSPAIAQMNLSSEKLCLSLNEVYFFCASYFLCTRTVLNLTAISL